MKVKNILIPDRVEKPDIESLIFDENYNITAHCVLSEKDIDDKIWASADAILAWHDLNYDAELIAKLKSCKVIVRVGVGYDNVDLDAARGKNIIVCNFPDYGTNDVADHAIGLMLSLNRGLEKYNYEAKYNERWDWDAAGKLNRLTGSKMGIIGLGRIGTATAMRAKAFGMNVSFYDPYVHEGKDKSLMIKRIYNLEEILKLSDVISIHTPLTNETESMIDDYFFKKMKKSAILINTARGAIFNIKDLYNALKKGYIRAIGSDVFPIEPPEKTHPLIQAWRNDDEWIRGRFILTPHAAFYNQESYEEMRRKAALEAKRVLDGHRPFNQICI